LKKKLINGALFLVVIVLWSRIGLDVGQSVSGDGITLQKSTTHTETLDLTTLDRFVYKSTYRDIFSRINQSSSTRPPIVKKPKYIRRKSSLKLIGVIGNKNKPIAILENKQGTLYSSVGDSTSLGTITSITPDSVVITPVSGNPETLFLKL